MTLPIPDSGQVQIESAIGREYEQQRDLRDELYAACRQRELALSINSPCKSTRWASFKGSRDSLYHRFFPTAELLDMVSSPRKHPEFYVGKLREHVKADNARIWIPAFATPRTFQMVRFAKPDAEIWATDLCGTPVLTLGMCYGLNDEKLQTRILDVMKSPIQDAMDAIVADAFITRFTGKDRIKVLRIFYNALKPGGALIITVRIPEKDERTDALKLEKTTEQTSSYPEIVVNAYIKMLESVPGFTDPYLYSPEDLAADAKAYQESMKSGHALDEDDMSDTALVMRLAELKGAGSLGSLLVANQSVGGIGFSNFHADKSSKIFDITPRNYLQVTAIK